MSAQSKITSIKAQLFYNENQTNSESKNVSGTFSDNIIDSQKALWNTIIGEGYAEGYSTQTIIIVEIKSISQSNKKQSLKFVAMANKKIISQQQQTFSCVGDNTTYKLLFLLNNTGCDEIIIKADLIKDQKIISTFKKKIDFQCGE